MSCALRKLSMSGRASLRSKADARVAMCHRVGRRMHDAG